MKEIKLALILFLFGTGLYYFYQEDFGQQPGEAVQRMEHAFQLKETKMEKKSTPENLIASISVDGEVYNWIGRSTDELLAEFGEPIRKDLSSYGYTWWVYTDKKEHYIQFGIQDNQVVTLYGTGSALSTEPVQIGQSYEEIKTSFNLVDEVSVTKDGASYRFQLTEEEMKVTPIFKLNGEQIKANSLLKLTEDIFIQLYFDTFTKKLSSIRMLTPDILLMHRPYEVFYREALPQTPVLTEVEWAKVQQGMEQQILDVTNIVRQRHGLSKLEWDDKVANVAYKHSKDMALNDYFSHYTLEGKGLKERLREGEVRYVAAGENIAAQYTDGPAAVEGWLNSLSHREALLKEDYTHLGVGVYNYYYTQNFLQKP